LAVDSLTTDASERTLDWFDGGIVLAQDDTVGYSSGDGNPDAGK
jgi:hypothetical protein